MQPAEVVASLRDGVAFRCEADKAAWGADFAGAYDWMSAQMSDLLGPAPDGVRWPVWAWAPHGGWRPSLRASWGMVPRATRFGNRLNWPTRQARGLRWLALDVAPARVLLSDFDLWHSVLNDTYCVPRSRWDDDEVWEKVWTPQEIEASWRRVFTIDSVDLVQACLWEIRPEDVTASWPWWAPRATGRHAGPL